MFDPKIMALAVLVPLGVAASAPAIAQEGGDRGEAMFTQLDANGDGALSLEELQAGRDRFGAADSNGDGTITQEEMQAMATARAEASVARFFENFDSNGDGAVTEDEIAETRDNRQEERRAAMAERLFERADTDGDGLISAEEFAEARARMGERVGRGGPFGHRG